MKMMKNELKNENDRNWEIMRWKMRIIKIEIMKMKNENDEKWIKEWKW